MSENVSDPNESHDSTDSEEEEEPKLKYELIHGVLPKILKDDAASCIHVNDKLLLLGTNRGKVYVLDHQGNQIKEFDAHSGPVLSIDIDSSGDYIALGFHDRKVIVQNLYNNEISYNFVLSSPVRCLSIEPYFGKAKSKKRLIVGIHQVVLYEKGLFGSIKPTILYEGSRESREVIRSMSWHGRFMAWAMDSAVRVMDMEARAIISLIRRNHSLALGCDQYPPHICWQDDFTLLIGWGDSVKVCRVRERTDDLMECAAFDLPPFYVEIVYMFTTDFYVCGIGPLDQLVVVLAYNKSTLAEGKKMESLSQEWRRPQLRVLQPLQGTYEELSNDVIALKGYQDYQPVHYHLDHLGEDRRFYILCPKAVLVAKPREAHDRIKWLLEHKKFQDALEVVDNCGGKVGDYTVSIVGHTFINHLIANEEYEAAANIAPKILGQDKLQWEKIVICFNNLSQLKFLSRHIPTGPPGPLLSTSIYQTILLDLLKSDHETFLEIIQTWNKRLYNVSLIITNVLEVLARNSSNVVLLQALAHLYSNIDKHDKAFAIYLKLKHKDLFDLIRRFSLYRCVSKHIVDLMTLDADAALQMCSQHIDVISPKQVVTELSKHELFLYKYLDMLYREQRDSSVEFHTQLVKLYATYDRQKIMPLLRVSSHIDLESALDTVRIHGLAKETVYLLIRMGSSEAALNLVLLEQEDIEWAIRICKDHSDPDLWKLLIKHSIDKPQYILVLLNNIGTYVDPLLILRRIPSNMEIPGLRDALIKILHDYQLKISLQNDYQKILVNDCIKLLAKQVSCQQVAIAVRSDGECSLCNKKTIHSSIKNEDELVVFSCRHIYHFKCLLPEEPDFERCIVCTNNKKINIGS